MVEYVSGHERHIPTSNELADMDQLVDDETGETVAITEQDIGSDENPLSG